MLSLATRERLAAAAFAYTARYDAAISRWFAARVHEGFPPTWASSYEKVMDLRYGENPHQQAAFYAEVGAPTHLLEGVSQLHGKELSCNNLLDLSAARELVEELAFPASGGPADGAAAAVIIKHNNPCGCALADSGKDAYERAFVCDPLSAYGGVIATSRRVDAPFADSLSKQFVEVLLAPGFDADAVEILEQKKNVRLLELRDWRRPGPGMVEKPVLGGVISQTRDAVTETREQMRVVTERTPSEEEWRDLLFAWVVCMQVRSNAIVIARETRRLGSAPAR